MQENSKGPSKILTTVSLVVLFAAAGALAVWTLLGSPGSPSNTTVPGQTQDGEGSFKGGGVPLSRQAAQGLENPYEVDDKFLAEGEKIYGNVCAQCHGAKGEGPPSHPFLQHSLHHTEGDYVWVVTYGIAGTPMAAQAGNLSLKERWAVVSYIRKAFPSPMTHGRQ